MESGCFALVNYEAIAGINKLRDFRKTLRGETIFTGEWPYIVPLNSIILFSRLDESYKFRSQVLQTIDIRVLSRDLFPILSKYCVTLMPTLSKRFARSE